MSQIRINQVDEENLIVEISPETSVESINRLCKGFTERGLTEDLSKSTVTNRHFYRSREKVHDVADELIKSLSSMTGLTKAKSYSAKLFYEAKNQQNLRDRNAMRANKGMAPITMDQHKNPAGQKPPPIPNAAAPAPKAGPVTTAGVPNKLVGEVGSGYSNSAKQYGTNTAKSDYGPQGAGQYNVNDNIRRKLNNVSDQRVPGVGGPSAAVKQYAAKLPAGQQTDPKLKRKQPVKKWTPEQIAEENAKRGLKKNAWGQHLEFPNGDEMVERYQPGKYETNEDRYANDLANLMNNRSLLGTQPPPQPTDQQMFGHLAVTEEQVKKSEQEWGGAINNWLAEATKPISSRFASEEEEVAYWNSIKVSDAP